MLQSTKTLLAAVILSVIATACAHKKECEISGTLTGGAMKSLYIEELTPNGPLFLDSIYLDDKGHFSYRFEPQYETFFNIHASKKDYVMLLTKQGESVKLDGDYQSLENTYEVRGSEGSILLWQLQNYGKEGDERLREIVAMDQKNKQDYAADPAKYREAKKMTDSLYWELYNQQSDYVRHFLEDNSGSLATLIALYKPLGPDHALIDIYHDPSLLSYYDMVLEGLQEKQSDNPHTTHFKNTVEELRYKYEQYQKQQQAQQLSVSVGE